MEQYNRTTISRILPLHWKVSLHEKAVGVRRSLRTAQAGERVGILTSSVQGLAWRLLEHGSGEKLPR